VAPLLKTRHFFSLASRNIGYAPRRPSRNVDYAAVLRLGEQWEHGRVRQQCRPCSNIAGGCPLLPTTLGPVFKSLQAKWPLAVPLVNSTVDCATDTTGVCISQDGWGANNLAVLPAYPVPIYGTATLSQSAPIDQFRWSFKFDHNFSSKDRLSATYLLENVHASLNFGGGDNAFSPPLEIPTGRKRWASLGPTRFRQPF